jgi:hypothetical protein
MTTDPPVVDGSAIDLSSDPDAIAARKRPVVRHVQFARRAGRCETMEGPVGYEVGDAIVTGELGEQWPVRRAFFLRTYDPVPPLAAGEDGPYRRREGIARARRLDQSLTLTIGKEQGRLSGVAGDWLVQHDDGSIGIVAGAIFAETYETD